MRHQKKNDHGTLNLAIYKRLPLILEEPLLWVSCLHGKDLGLPFSALSTCCFLFHNFFARQLLSSQGSHAPLTALFSNPQFSGFNSIVSRDLELEWGNCTAMKGAGGGTRQNKSLRTNPQSDSQGPVGLSESWREIRESFSWVSARINACVCWPEAGSGARQRDPAQPCFLCAAGPGGTGCLCCLTLSWPSVCGLHLTLQITLAL